MRVVSTESLTKGASPVSVSVDQKTEKSKPFYFQVMVKAENAVSLGFVRAALDMQDAKASFVRRNGQDYLSLTGKTGVITGREEDILRQNHVIESGMYGQKPEPQAIVNTHFLFSRSKKPSGLIAKFG